MADRTKRISVLMLVLIAISIANGAELREAPASDVLAKIKAGQPVEFDNCIIVGDLNLSTLKIDKQAHFNHTLFQDSVNFEKTTFNGDAYFMSSTFKGYAFFRSSTFNGEASFDSSTFNGEAYFDSSTFKGYASFGSSTFKGTASFMSSTFKGTANFGYSEFNGDASFDSSTFNGTASFDSSIFNGTASFDSSIFNGTASFDSSIFNGTASFDSSIFNGTASFVENTFDKEANFNDAVFNKNASASFNSSQFKENALFENTTFQSKLSLTKTRYDKVFIRWYNIKGGLLYDDAAYMSLLKNFKDLGYFEDYDSCYFQYRKEHRGQPWPGIDPFEASVRKFFDIFLEYFYGYGKKPLLPLGWSLGVMFVFGILWSAIGQRKQEAVLDEYDPTPNEIDKNLRDEISSIINPFLFSVIVFLSGTKLFIDPPDVPDARSLTKVAFTLERVLGALFSILFFLAISGTVVR